MGLNTLNTNKLVINLPPREPNGQGNFSTIELGGGLKRHLCPILGPINDDAPWQTLLHELTKANIDDEFTFLFNSPGGSVSVGTTLINAIQNTKATTYGVVVGECASIAALMLCACANISAAPLTHVMFHGTSGGLSGKTLDIEEQTTAINEYMATMFDTLCSKLLTVEERKLIITTKRDFYLSALEVNKRCASQVDEPQPASNEPSGQISLEAMLPSLLSLGGN